MCVCVVLLLFLTVYKAIFLYVEYIRIYVTYIHMCVHCNIIGPDKCALCKCINLICLALDSYIQYWTCIRENF